MSTEMEEIEEMTYSELLATAMMNDEIVITIANEDVERVKIGIKNVKAKQAAKLKEEGLVPDPSILNFFVTPIENSEDVELKIVLSRKSVVRVKHIHIPDGEF